MKIWKICYLWLICNILYSTVVSQDVTHYGRISCEYIQNDEFYIFYIGQTADTRLQINEYAANFILFWKLESSCHKIASLGQFLGWPILSSRIFSTLFFVCTVLKSFFHHILNISFWLIYRLSLHHNHIFPTCFLTFFCKAVCTPDRA